MWMERGSENKVPEENNLSEMLHETGKSAHNCLLLTLIPLIKGDLLAVHD